MAITSLYGEYFQKSKIFFYPLLDIKKGSSVLPVETYLSWQDNYDITSAKLIVTYKIREDNDYIQFEKHVLLKHSRLTDFKKAGDTFIAIFDFSDLQKDWDYLVEGKYSLLNTFMKRKVCAYFQDNKANSLYINSYLYPEDHYEIYSDLLNADIDILKDVGELCSKPNLQLECFTETVESLEKIKILD